MKFQIKLHGKHGYERVDYVVMNLTQLERIESELKRRFYS